MENTNGGFGISDIIAGRGLGIGGFGYGNGDYLTSGALADGTALKTASDCHAHAMEASLARTSAQALETREILRTDQMNKNFSDAEFREGDRLRDVSNLVTDGQKEQANCCCETQKLILAESNATQKEVTAQACATRELINQNLIAQLNRELVDAKNNVTSSNIIQANNTAIQAQTATLLAHLG